MTKKEQRAAAIAAGRKYLRAWLLGAMRTGRVYYTVSHVSRSGMRREIKLYRTVKGAVEQLWPHGNGSDDLDVVAKDWGFNFSKRAFVVDGCGMDMVFACVDNLQHLAGLGKTAWEWVDRNGKRVYVRTDKPRDGRGRVVDFTNALQRSPL